MLIKDYTYLQAALKKGLMGPNTSFILISIQLQLIFITMIKCIFNKRCPKKNVVKHNLILPISTYVCA